MGDRQVGALALLALAAGCSGKDDADDTGSTSGECSPLGTEPLGQVEVSRWPAGLSDQLPVFDQLGGRYEATSSCGGEVVVKITTIGREQLGVVTTPYPAGTTSCGCSTDPAYGADSTFTPVAVTDEVQLYVEPLDGAEIDPALDRRTLAAEGTVFSTSAPFAFRACAVDDVDPYLQSELDQVSVIFRMTTLGEPSASFVLTPLEGSPTTCELSDFTKIGGP